MIRDLGYLAASILVLPVLVITPHLAALGRHADVIAAQRAAIAEGNSRIRG
jgi:hypothetical protein